MNWQGTYVTARQTKAKQQYGYMFKLWDTRLISPQRRVEFWRAAVCDAFLAMTPRIPTQQDFAASLEHLTIDQLALNRVVAPAHGVSRTPSDLSRSERGTVFLNLPLQGRASVKQGGRLHVAQPGEFMLIDASRAYAIDIPEGGILLSLALPLEALQRSIPDLPDRCGSPIPASPAACLLEAQIRILAETSSPLLERQSLAIASVLLELVAAACTPDVSDTQVQHSSGLLARVRLLIKRHLADAQFGPAEAADAAHVSVRTLHAAFAREGSSFSAEQMDYRLRHAHQQLLTGQTTRTVSDIARDCGFTSASHFGRRFRMRYGTSPDQLRKFIQ